LIVTVPVVEDPPVTDVGLSETPVTTSGVTVRVPVWLVVPVVPVIVSVALAETAEVVTVNVAVV